MDVSVFRKAQDMKTTIEIPCRDISSLAIVTTVIHINGSGMEVKLCRPIKLKLTFVDIFSFLSRL